MSKRWFHVTSRNATFAIVSDGEKIIDTAPVGRWLRGAKEVDALDALARRRYIVTEFSIPEEFEQVVKPDGTEVVHVGRNTILQFPNGSTVEVVERFGAWGVV